MLRPLCSAVLDELSTDEQITQQQQLTRNNWYYVNRYCCISYFNICYLHFRFLLVSAVLTVKRVLELDAASAVVETTDASHVL